MMEKSSICSSWSVRVLKESIGKLRTVKGCLDD
jgi:hypothetical protein